MIRLYSRYNEEFVELIPLNSHIYRIDFTHNPYSYRIMSNEDGSIKAFDPSGGPFVSVGSTIENRKVLAINLDDNKDLLITLE